MPSKKNLATSNYQKYRNVYGLMHMSWDTNKHGTTLSSEKLNELLEATIRSSIDDMIYKMQKKKRNARR